MRLNASGQRFLYKGHTACARLLGQQHHRPGSFRDAAEGLAGCRAEAKDTPKAAGDGIYGTEDLGS
jgi:hypothetical protein